MSDPEPWRVNLELRRRFYRAIRGPTRMSCWRWAGTVDKDGNNVMKIGKAGKHTLTAKRASWIIHYGPVPEGVTVYCRCSRIRTKDYVDCVNPNHLFLSTRKNYIDNFLLANDELAHLSRHITLCKEDVMEVRRLSRKGLISKRQIAGQFHVPVKQVELLTQERATCKRQYWFEPPEVENMLD